jgi:anaerobic selenocysteine-containing dehydrogenase
MCGVVIKVEDQHVVSIKGDEHDPLSKGHICPKALALKDIHEDPDRLRKPLLKTENGWEEISWKRAFDLAARQLRNIRTQYGRHAIGAYSGNPNTHHHGNLIGLGLFLDSLRTQNKFSATSNDQLPHMLANLQLFGNQMLFPIPDIDHTDLFILLGSNPAASNGSLMSAPDMVGRLKSMRKRGGKVILIDPRQTETARVVDQHIPVRPGTDAFLLLGMLHTLFDESLVGIGRLAANTDGLAQIQLMCSDFSPETVSAACGVSAVQIRELARQLAATPRACIFGRVGTSTQEFGAVATWLIYLLNILTSHLDERGGLMFPKPAADITEFAALMGQSGHFDRWQSSTGLPEFNGELPASSLADQILNPGDKQIRAMVVIAGNPVLSSPNGRRLEQALEQLDFMLSIDMYLNETSRHADLILPPTSPLEQSHFDLAFNLLAVRNVAKYSPPLFKPARDARHDWQILLELFQRLQTGTLQQRLRTQAVYQLLKRLGPDTVLDLMLRVGPYGTQVPGTSSLGAMIVDAAQDLVSEAHPIRKLLDLGPYGASNRSLSKGLCVSSLMNYAHGIDLGSLQPCLPGRLYTSGKRINLAPPLYLKDLSRLRKRLAGADDDGKLLLIGRRHVRSNNSWLHNSERLIKGPHRCTMMIHPDDAKRLHLEQGDLATVTSRVGSIDIETELFDGMMPGVISIPHGWGHHRPGTRQSNASKRPGVSINDLSDDRLVDRLSGTSALNGVPVSVCKARTAPMASTTQSRTRKPRVRVTAGGDA